MCVLRFLVPSPHNEAIRPRRAVSRRLRSKPDTRAVRIHHTHRPRHDRGRKRDASREHADERRQWTASRACDNDTRKSRWDPTAAFSILSWTSPRRASLKNQRERHIVADVTKDSVLMVKQRRKEHSVRWAFATGGSTVMAHVPQMYSLYELYFAAGLQRIRRDAHRGRDTARFPAILYRPRLRSSFPLHGGQSRRRLPGGKARDRARLVGGHRRSHTSTPSPNA